MENTENKIDELSSALSSIESRVINTIENFTFTPPKEPELTPREKRDLLAKTREEKRINEINKFRLDKFKADREKRKEREQNDYELWQKFKAKGCLIPKTDKPEGTMLTGEV